MVFRQSCIYGTRQFGVEDQGWLAWITIAAVKGRRKTIYGDGKQVRDVLHVYDLLRGYDAAIRADGDHQGPGQQHGRRNHNVLAVWSKFGPILEKLLGRNIKVEHVEWRPGDQRVFLC